MYFLSLVEFLEKSSITFSGFSSDINQLIIEKDVFNFMFDILEYYRLSDVFSQKVFKLITNIIKSKNEDISEMIRYLVEETNMIKFLINNGPKITERLDQSTKDLADGQPSSKKEPSTPESKKTM